MQDNEQSNKKILALTPSYSSMTYCIFKFVPESDWQMCIWIMEPNDMIEA